MTKTNSQLIIYQTESGETKIDVRLEDETVWLTQKLMATLFDCSIDNISLHLKNIFKEEELNKKSVVEDFSVTASDGKFFTCCQHIIIATFFLRYCDIFKKKIKEYTILKAFYGDIF